MLLVRPSLSGRPARERVTDLLGITPGGWFPVELDPATLTVETGTEFRRIVLSLAEPPARRRWLDVALRERLDRPAVDRVLHRPVQLAELFRDHETLRRENRLAAHEVQLLGIVRHELLAALGRRVTVRRPR